MTDKVIFLLSGSSWTVPNDWNSAANTIEMIDGGGAGGDNGGGAYYGGDGGQYRKYVNVSLTKGATASYNVGLGRTFSTGPGSASSHTGCTTAAVTNNGGLGANAGSFNQGVGGGAAGPGGAGSGQTPGGGSWTSTHNATGGVAVLSATPGGGGGVGGGGTSYGGGGGSNFDPEGGGNEHGSGADGLIVVTYTPLPEVTGSLSSTEAKDSFAGAGTVRTVSTGTLAATEAQDSFAASGTVANPGVTGALTTTEAADVFAAAGSVVTGVAVNMAAVEAPDRFAAAGSVQNTSTSGAGGGGYTVNPWEEIRKIRKAKRDKVVDLAPPPIIDAAEEARKAAALEVAKAERVQRLKGEMAQDSQKETDRQAKAAARALRQADEERKAKAASLVAALDPRAVEKEHRRQRQVAANHAHHAMIGGKIAELAGHVVHHLITTPRKK